ncbi:MerR family transcriptional regulator [Thermobifida halotolerans]|uniref:MerR family transcriptional regulator n=1 Tax=Thermobifida halotolerans TaxID=483545 RepID=A0A399G4F3_9ACTN|nr:MerR family transcriptional regulator [Thermobifida halotolerans]UOE18399.1 MerR family transcriptional regulator [Thermobifida halotolerans]
MRERGGRFWKVGELARLTGLTVRTLHHYEHVGVLRPSARTPAGHRLYGEADVRRLYQVVALRELGLPLEAIGTVLAGDVDLAELLGDHLAHVDRRLAALRSLRDRLTALAAAARSARGLRSDDLLGLMEEVTTMEETIRNHYTGEQLAYLERRRRELGDEAVAAVEAEWPRLIAEVRSEMAAGTDPADPKVRALATRWTELVEMFHGGDEGVRDSLHRMYQERGDGIAEQYGGPTSDMIAYVQRAIDSSAS